MSVLAVCGLYRTGKSSLLNWLCDPEVNKEFDLQPSTNKPSGSEAAENAGGGGGGSDGSGGFAVGATVQRCTRGIWLWGRPRAVKLANGEYGALLVLDTEGLGGLESGAQYDARIFALATLLCSTLTYNSLGTIDEKAIASLSFVAQLAKNIRLTSSSPSPSSSSPPPPDSSSSTNSENPPAAAGAGSGAAAGSGAGAGSGGKGEGLSAAAAAGELQRFFPSFVWVVRDFALDLRDEDGGEITPDEYLNLALRFVGVGVGGGGGGGVVVHVAHTLSFEFCTAPSPEEKSIASLDLPLSLETKFHPPSPSPSTSFNNNANKQAGLNRALTRLPWSATAFAAPSPPSSTSEGHKRWCAHCTTRQSYSR